MKLSPVPIIQTFALAALLAVGAGACRELEEGGTGSITPLRGQIIVRNSILVHQLLGGYLEEDQVAGR